MWLMMMDSIDSISKQIPKQVFFVLGKQNSWCTQHLSIH